MSGERTIASESAPLVCLRLSPRQVTHPPLQGWQNLLHICDHPSPRLLNLWLTPARQGSKNATTDAICICIKSALTDLLKFHLRSCPAQKERPSTTTCLGKACTDDLPHLRRLRGSNRQEGEERDIGSFCHDEESSRKVTEPSRWSYISRGKGHEQRKKTPRAPLFK